MHLMHQDHAIAADEASKGGRGDARVSLASDLHLRQHVLSTASRMRSTTSYRVWQHAVINATNGKRREEQSSESRPCSRDPQLPSYEYEYWVDLERLETPVFIHPQAIQWVETYHHQATGKCWEKIPIMNSLPFPCAIVAVVITARSNSSTWINKQDTTINQLTKHNNLFINPCNLHLINPSIYLTEHKSVRGRWYLEVEYLTYRVSPIIPDSTTIRIIPGSASVPHVLHPIEEPPT